MDSSFLDIIVMKNLGYWQLPVNIGVWKPNIAECSKCSSILEMVDGKILADGSMKRSCNRKIIIIYPEPK